MKISKKYFLEENFEQLIESNAGYALLIFQGAKGKQDLRELFQIIKNQPNNKSIWIENPKKEYHFLKIISKEIGIKNLSSTNLTYNYVMAKLADTKIKTNLFIPSLEKIFYNFDKQSYSLKKARFNARLRASWYHHDGLLHICASVENENSEEYKSTLGNPDFPFYVNNFCVREITD